MSRCNCFKESSDDMNLLSRLAKSLSVLLITLSIALNVSLGLAILIIWRFIIKFKEVADLTTSGTQVMATVVRIETRETHSITFGSPTRVVPTRKTSRLVATCQHPQTGKIYTLMAPISFPDRFPIGSSVAFLVNFDNPLSHRLMDITGAFTPMDSDQPTLQDA